MQSILNIAVKAARVAGNTIARNYDRRSDLKVQFKGRHDYVTDIDKQAENDIIKIIKKAYPEHGILAEETHSICNTDSRWIIDPLDGTTNYIHGFPQFSVSIAFEYKNRIEVGVVYDPISQDLFTAIRGSGAKLNDRRIRVTSVKGLENALIGTGFPYTDYSRLNDYMVILESIIKDSSGIRRAGSAALDLAWVASGRMDGFWEFGLKPWDIAAGIILVREAGGFIGDLNGGDTFLECGDVVAGGPKIYSILLSRMKKIL